VPYDKFKVWQKAYGDLKNYLSIIETLEKEITKGVEVLVGVGESSGIEGLVGVGTRVVGLESVEGLAIAG